MNFPCLRKLNNRITKQTVRYVVTEVIAKVAKKVVENVDVVDFKKIITAIPKSTPSAAVLESADCACKASLKIVKNELWYQKGFFREIPRFIKESSTTMATFVNGYALMGIPVGIVVVGFTTYSRGQAYVDNLDLYVQANIAFSNLIQFYGEYDPNSRYFNLEQFLALEQIYINKFLAEIETLKSLRVIDKIINNVGFLEDETRNLKINQYILNHQNRLENIKSTSVQKNELICQLENLKFKNVIKTDPGFTIPDSTIVANQAILDDASIFLEIS